jgi:hypothetical protein
LQVGKRTWKLSAEYLSLTHKKLLYTAIRVVYTFTPRLLRTERNFPG